MEKDDVSKLFIPKDKKKVVENQKEKQIDDDDKFVPVRKELKRKSTGKEDNFMPSYYSSGFDYGLPQQQQLDFNQIRELRWVNNIQV